MSIYNAEKIYASSMQFRRYRFFTWALLITLVMGLIGPGGSLPALAVDAPELLAPANGVTVTAIDDSALPSAVVSPPVALPEFSWTSVTGATKYRIQISSTLGFNVNTYREYDTPLTRFIPTNSAEFPDGTWYWRVRVQEPTAGPFSSIRSFTRQWASPNNKPNLISPNDGATLDFFDAPAFSWSPVVGAARYRLEISTSSSFSTLSYTRTTLATTHQPENKLANGTYYWRVVPIDPANQEQTRAIAFQPASTFNRYSSFQPACRRLA